MLEPFNFHDSWYLVQTNWVWLALALALGIWVGWRSNAPDAG